MIDQAYVEFGGTDLSHLVSERDNVVVVRTFSKAFALAGARVGYILAPEGISAQLDAIRLPAGIAAPSARMAEIALERRDQIAPTVELTCRERDRMAAALREAGYTVPESRANFVYVDLGRPNDDALTRLLERGLVVRSYADQPTALRITVAGPRDNDQLLETLCGSRPVRPAAAAAGGRRGEAERRTKETDVRCTVDVDGGGTAGVTTGIGFLDHMLSALASTPCSTSSSPAPAICGSTSTTPSRTSPSCSARRSTARSASAAASPATATPGRRWTRRSAMPRSTSAAAGSRPSSSRFAATAWARCPRRLSPTSSTR